MRAIDEAIFVQPYESFTDGAREAGIESEAFARPIAAIADLHHLLGDSAAGFFFPFPDAFLEFLAAESAVIDSFFGQQADYYALRRNARVICAWEPEGVEAGHAAPARENVDFRVVEHMADVQRAGDVRRRNGDRPVLAGIFYVGDEELFVEPIFGPALLNFLRLVGFGDLAWHWSSGLSTANYGSRCFHPRDAGCTANQSGGPWIF